jgi:RNase adapter protein RapZ
MDLLVISGLSGGGKSTALRALEDLGAYCVDNVPIPLLPDLIGLVARSDARRLVGVCVDAREAEYLAEFPGIHQRLQAQGHRVSVLFVEAANDVLVRRYSETRRMHPMGELPHAIDRERELLRPIRDMAEHPIDTSMLGSRQLRQLIRDRFASRGTGALRLALMSFGFRAGLPSEADVVLDCRFLDNPNDVDELRPLSGLHEPVVKYVLEQPDAAAMLDQAEALVRFMVPRSAAEGRSYLTVAIGCTGGQHRSVALVEALEERLSSGPPLQGPAPRVLVRHRDVASRASREDS